MNAWIDETLRLAPSTSIVSPFRTSKSIEPAGSRCQTPWLFDVVIPLPAIVARNTNPPSAGAQNWVNEMNFTVPETLGGAGVSFAPKDLEQAAELLGALIYDAPFRAGVLEGQRRRVRDFDPASVAASYRRLLETVTS